MTWTPSVRTIVERMHVDADLRFTVLRDPKAAVLYQLGPLTDDEQLMIVEVAERWGDPNWAWLTSPSS
jgi:hypothetical protein